jgi:hypothetical protein
VNPWFGFCIVADKSGGADRENGQNIFRRAKQGDSLPIFAESSALNHRKI